MISITERCCSSVRSLPRAAVALVAVAMLVACGGTAPASSPTVPDVVGQALDTAKTTLQDAGFDAAPQDLLRGRNQLLDSDWTVCTQNPGPVPTTHGETVDLGVVKKAETCPTPAATATPTRAATRKPHPTSKPRSAAKTQVEAAPTSAGSDLGTVIPGTFCNPPATGISPKGNRLVCAPAADGRNRWESA